MKWKKGDKMPDIRMTKEYEVLPEEAKNRKERRKNEKPHIEKEEHVFDLPKKLEKEAGRFCIDMAKEYLDMQWILVEYKNNDDGTGELADYEPTAPMMIAQANAKNMTTEKYMILSNSSDGISASAKENIDEPTCIAWTDVEGMRVVVCRNGIYTENGIKLDSMEKIHKEFEAYFNENTTSIIEGMYEVGKDRLVLRRMQRVGAEVLPEMLINTMSNLVYYVLPFVAESEKVVVQVPLQFNIFHDESIASLRDKVDSKHLVVASLFARGFDGVSTEVRIETDKLYSNIVEKRSFFEEQIAKDKEQMKKMKIQWEKRKQEAPPKQEDADEDNKQE